ncbi:MAG TPA: acetyl-CoA carboxylase biotin carboxyl carrier protein subunit [Bacteroidales bacterium]|nr:acetyl-CoA carboxylase biotin carboxyl carrier protein subunit [Bacteroidales bacterium]
MAEKSTAGSNNSTGSNSKDEKTKFKSLTIEGTKYRTLLSGKFENRKKWENPDINKIYSFIPGTVLKIYVKAGQTVKEGQNMLVLEAMKMQNRIQIPFNGKIKGVYVKEGDKIPKGSLMVEFEPPEV